MRLVYLDGIYKIHLFFFRNKFSIGLSQWLSLSYLHIEADNDSRYIPDDIFKGILLNEKYKSQISLNFDPKGPIHNPALVQIMRWHRPGDEPLIVWTNDG